MKLDWRKMSRKFLLNETIKPVTLTEKISHIKEIMLELEGKDKLENFKLAEIIEDLDVLNNTATSTLKELNELKNRVKLLEENLIDELLE